MRHVIGHTHVLADKTFGFHFFPQEMSDSFYYLKSVKRIL